MKKMLIGSISAMLCAVCLSAGIPAAAASVTAGDINVSGAADIADAVLLLRLVGEDLSADAAPVIPAEGLAAADFDRNGFLDMRDVSSLLRLIDDSEPSEDGQAEPEESAAVSEDGQDGLAAVFDEPEESASGLEAPADEPEEPEDAQADNAAEHIFTGTLVQGNAVYFYDKDGNCLNAENPLDAALFEVIENAPRREEMPRVIEIWDNDSIDCFMRTEFPTELYAPCPRYRIYDKDIALLEAFAAEHFTDEMTVTQKLWITHQWIHSNVTYAFADVTPEGFWSLTYADAIFRLQLGQCVHYNGAMADMLAYLGFDVYMVKGKVGGRNQHFWTEVLIGDQRYYVETGNKGKNGSYWQYFFEPVAG